VIENGNNSGRWIFLRGCFGVPDRADRNNCQTCQGDLSNVHQLTSSLQNFGLQKRVGNGQSPANNQQL
jgi:hypothetical protein